MASNRFHKKLRLPPGFYDIAEDSEADEAYPDDVEIETFSSGEDDTWDDFDVAIRKGEKLHKASQSFTSTRTYVPPKRIGPRNLIKSATELRTAPDGTGANEDTRNWRTILNNGKIKSVRGVDVVNKPRQEIQSKQNCIIGCENKVQPKPDDEVKSAEKDDTTTKHVSTIQQLRIRLRERNTTPRECPEYNDLFESRSNCSTESSTCELSDSHNSNKNELETSVILGQDTEDEKQDTDELGTGTSLSVSDFHIDTASPELTSSSFHKLKAATGGTALVSLRAVELFRDSVTPSDIDLMTVDGLEQTTPIFSPLLNLEQIKNSIRKICYVSSHPICNNLGLDFQFLETFKIQYPYDKAARSTINVDKVRFNPTADSSIAPYLRYASVLDSSTAPHNPLCFVPEWQPNLFPVRPLVRKTVDKATHHTFPRVQNQQYKPIDIDVSLQDTNKCL